MSRDADAPADESGTDSGGAMAPRPAPDDAVLSVEEVTSGYGDVEVLHDLSMHLLDDEIVCMIGPNGAGKSTVLKTVFGLLQPWSGAVRLLGEDISGLVPEDVVREGVGYVPQIDNVFGSLSVAENLRMGGVSVKGDIDGTVQDLYDQFPLLAEKRSEKARTLSGGQQQILAFARALMTEPDVLLIDEPSAGLAPDTAENVFERVERINEGGTAILMVEQNAVAGLGISDRGYVLDQGTVRYEGEADSLVEDPEVAELYLGG
jgi:ABC-type branched-subunit amino acid transport system ATPase component